METFYDAIIFDLPYVNLEIKSMYYSMRKKLKPLELVMKNPKRHEEGDNLRRLEDQPPSLKLLAPQGDRKNGETERGVRPEPEKRGKGETEKRQNLRRRSFMPVC